FGFSTILRVFSGFVGQEGGQAKLATLGGHEWFGIWQGLLRVVGAFGDCPRCLAVCPVGEDYNLFLKEAQREIPEKTAEKVARARELLGIRKRGEPIRGMADGRVRWIGEDGYRPPARRAGTPA
ncbi:MAG: hypothetical protein ACRELZ_16895, partial [Candidatus Rokuibacteriota bacterium]